MTVPSPPPLHVLLAEDEVLVAMAMEDSLTRAGFHVTVTHNGRDALEADARDQADVLLTDLRMPIMDGMALIQRLRGDRPDLPVVVVTGTPPEGGVAGIQSGNSGCTLLLVKPVSMADLVVAVQRVIGRA
ncbi:response regulator [Azospirillum isscasi]|uniref:Response regulator n=1 Tax=Azospirillum isscasi TaxID=3053926 RepID=A0ABU0WPH0_9PROT|nr:response regulator [Azospirillum isscasi]MDQ2106105.1 response regulator [Azospirillum isscasi]